MTRALALLLAWVGVAAAQSFPHGGTMTLATCTIVTGATPLFLGSGTCADAVEASVEQRWRVKGTLANLECTAGGDFGSGKTITVTGRTGGCGALAPSGTFTCALSGGTSRPHCTGSTNLMTVAAGECWTLGLTFSATLTTNVDVICTLERAN